ncbi:hypothetical protein, partial [Treponema sp. R6D11]
MGNLTGDSSPPADTPADAPAGNAISALDDFLKEINTPSQSEPEPDKGADDLSSFLSGMQDQATADTPANASGTDDLSSFLGGEQDEAAADTPTDASDADDLSSFLGDSQEEPAPDLSANEGGIPDDLLSGFSDEMESAPSDTGLPDFSQEDFGVEEPKAESKAEPKVEPKQEEPENDDLGGIDLGGESRESVADTSAEADADAAAGLDDFNFNVDTIDSGTPDKSADSSASADAPQADLDLNGIDLGGESPHDFAPEEPATPKEPEETQVDNQDLSGIDLGGESLDIPPETASDDLALPADSFDSSVADTPVTDDATLDTNFD